MRALGYPRPISVRMLRLALFHLQSKSLDVHRLDVRSNRRSGATQTTTTKQSHHLTRAIARIFPCAVTFILFNLQMENFRTPNFPLVADALYWLVLRYDPMAKVPEDIDTEAHRVEFVMAATMAMHAKARIQLKAKNIYAADGRAVKELLKIAKVLYR